VCGNSEACLWDDVFKILFRLNTRFEFSELRSPSSNDNEIFKSPPCSEVASAADLPRSPGISIKPTMDLPQRCSSKALRKFLSEPSLVSNEQSHSRSRCGFRERMQSDCAEEDFPHNISDGNSHTRQKTCHKREHYHARHAHLKSRPKFRKPLSDCGSRLNSTSPTKVSVVSKSSSSLSEEEIRSVCVDVVLTR